MDHILTSADHTAWPMKGMNTLSTIQAFSPSLPFHVTSALVVFPNTDKRTLGPAPFSTPE